MTIQDLEVLAADLYKDAEESSPIFGHTEKKEWMAKKLEQDIEDDGSMLGHYLAYDDVDGILDDLEQQYENRDKEDLTIRDRMEDKREEVKETISGTGSDVKKEKIIDKNGHREIDRPDNKRMDEPDEEIVIVETNDEVIIFETENADDPADYKTGPSSQSGKCHR